MKKLLLTVVLGLCTLAGFSQAKFYGKHHQ